MGGADALAEMVGETCDMDGMDEKVWIHLISQSMLKLRILWELKKFITCPIFYRHCLACHLY